MGVRTIDYVVPMVFHNDSAWQESFKQAGRQYDEQNVINFVRFRSWGTEELLVRCVLRFMPWVRRIYILLAQESQVQPWMKELAENREVQWPEVRVVFHREFMPQWALPTFNSCAIEMFLHKIPGLSERFVYGNDDMFPLSELRESDFFRATESHGTLWPCQHYEERAFPEKPNVFHRICRNGQNFVAREFGMRLDGVILMGGHGMTPMLKSTWEHLWERGGDEIKASVSAFRGPKNFIQWICPWWHHLTGKYVDYVPKRVYVSVKKPVEDVVRVIEAENAGIVCVNDHECERDYEKYGRAVAAAIKRKLETENYKEKHGATE